jgi:hypothetical protein
MEMTMVEKIRPIEKVEDLTPVQRLAKLDAERAEILASAKADALKKANEAVAELNLLGFHYLLCEEGEKPSSKKGEQTGPCPVCKFMTDPPHGGRTHKSQTEKKAFTDEELKQKGLVKV